ncbi:MAG: RNA polymerase sigma factor [Myxococcales bacterium]|nr:sigma-70 family RNA polymerase sigma factor [Myxococcales bacterium]
MILRDGDSELDELTLRRAQAGDDAACRALVERYQRPVFALISRTIGHGPLVEDLAQETFLKAFRALARFDPAGRARFSTWLLTIAARLAIDHARRREPAPDRPRLAAGSAELRTALAAAVESLPPDFRAAFLLREAHGFSTAEVAEALGVEEGTVKSRLSRAREALRQILGDFHD